VFVAGILRAGRKQQCRAICISIYTAGHKNINGGGHRHQ
jgi:hypothetical protein